MPLASVGQDSLSPGLQKNMSVLNEAVNSIKLSALN